jgi:hypothetical protein
MSNIVQDYSTTVMDIYQKVIQRYESNIQTIKQTEEELNDIYHECELSEPKNVYQGYLMYKAIREIRQKRRTAKNENELLQNMYELLKSQQGQQFKKSIQSIQGSSITVSEAQDRRVYLPKHRSDLTIAGQNCPVANKPFEDMLKEFKQTSVTTQKGKLRK